jgi:hypothetical protein
MSSKGYSSRAARDLIDLIADTADTEPVTVFCIHDGLSVICMQKVPLRKAR